MKIKLAILEADINYLSRIVSILTKNYSHKLAVFAFSDLDGAMTALSKEKIDVFLADDSFEIKEGTLPQKCGFAYFVDSPDVKSVGGIPTVCKFQRVELIYKQILSVFSDSLEDASIRSIYNNGTKVILFSSPCGGVGTSTVAAACAVHFALSGKRALYLNLENFSGADMYFTADGLSDMSDVIYALKSGKGNLALKLESCVRCDSNGTYFFASAKVALDMMELTFNDKVNLLSALTDSGAYDYVIVDTEFSLDKEAVLFFHQAHTMVWVTDGQAVSDKKMDCAYTALKMLEQNAQNRLFENVCVINNKHNENLGVTQMDNGPRIAGVLPKLRHRVGESIIEKLAVSDVFERILDV